MNGNTLKWAFSVIVWTFCFILGGSTLAFLLGKLTPDVYEKVIDKLGIIGFFTMIGQAFLHADLNKDGVPDSHQITKEKEQPKPEVK